VNVWLGDFNQHLTIASFRDVKINDIERFLQTVKSKTADACVQFFDASLIAGWEHLRFAALNALYAFKGGVNISSSPAMEMLLYASAQRQIKEAVKIMGIKPDSRRVALVVLAENQQRASEVLESIGKTLGGTRDDSVLKLTDGKIADLKRLFNISEAELEAKMERRGAQKKALTDLVIEHMALLVTQR